MPHVTVKLHAGRSAKVKSDLADAITKAVVQTLNLSEASVSVSIQDVQPQDWAEQVYRPEITGRPDILFKKPGYSV
jgi:4-oxalocrotonate tautomerase